jgi:hypothetical protein
MFATSKTSGKAQSLASLKFTVAAVSSAAALLAVSPAAQANQQCNAGEVLVAAEARDASHATSTDTSGKPIVTACAENWREPATYRPLVDYPLQCSAGMFLVGTPVSGSTQANAVGLDGTLYFMSCSQLHAAANPIPAPVAAPVPVPVTVPFNGPVTNRAPIATVSPIPIPVPPSVPAGPGPNPGPTPSPAPIPGLHPTSSPSPSPAPIPTSSPSPSPSPGPAPGPSSNPTPSLAPIPGLHPTSSPSLGPSVVPNTQWPTQENARQAGPNAGGQTGRRFELSKLGNSGDAGNFHNSAVSYQNAGSSASSDRHRTSVLKNLSRTHASVNTTRFHYRHAIRKGRR